MAIIEEVVDDVHAAPPVKPPVKKEKPAFVPADTFEVGARVGRRLRSTAAAPTRRLRFPFDRRATAFVDRVD